MCINFQQNQVKTQVMTVPTRYQITAKRNYGHRRIARRTDGRTDRHTYTDTHRRTDGRTDIASDNIMYFLQKRKKC